MNNRSRLLRVSLYTALICSASATPALAYIGPGAGIAAAGSVMVLLGTFLLAFGIVLIYPIKVVARAISSIGRAKPRIKRVVVVGLDGLDPGLAKRFAEEGLMPNFKALEEQGCFNELATACPSISPVSWSSYATGVDASRHNIYDFLTRDPCSYLPVLSSSETATMPKSLNLGFAKIPFGTKIVHRALQKSQPFWKLLGAQNVWSSIIRVPITYPVKKFKNGTLLAGMCVPDLQGTQGSFSFYSTKPRKSEGGGHIGGQQYQVRIGGTHGNVIASKLKGPPGADGHAMRSDFSVQFDVDAGTAKFTCGKESAVVERKEYTPWMRIEFDGGVVGIARFYVQTWEDDDIGIYVTPVNIDPDSPIMPISHPFVYSIYLAKTIGPYATLGLAEDTWALNERVVDEEAFLKQAWLLFEERKKMLWDVLDKTKKGFVTCVFDTSDRISHMFYRYLDPTHPANAGRDTEIHKNTIRDTYARMDTFLAEIREKLGDEKDTLLMIISDHGFTNFRRGVNLNTWLKDEGYLVLKEGKETSGNYFEAVDWDKTRAFTLGLTGIFINRKGREGKGIVPKGPELDALVKEIKGKLEKLVDPQDGKSVIREAFVTTEMHSGPYADMAPELLIGYEKNFRHSWECAVGAVLPDVFSDNIKSWSGDHCVDPRLVPGVFWSNREITHDKPEISDLAPTVLELFGVERPNYMKGTPLFEGSDLTLAASVTAAPVTKVKA
jgi:predicted AlkP superfamily phosphohydrolase/phosphomutase